MAALQREIRSRLNQAGMQPHVASDADWLRRMQVMFNPGKHTSWAKGPVRVKPSIPLKHQILQPGRMVTCDGDGISLVGSMSDQKDEHRVIRVLNCFKRPDYCNFGQMYSFFSDWDTGRSGIFDDFLLSLNIHFPNKKKSKSSFDRKKIIITNQQIGNVMKYSTKLRYQFDDFKTVEHELEQENHRVVNSWLQLSVFTEKDEGISDRIGSAISFLESKGYGYGNDGTVAMPLLLETLPLCHGYDAHIRSYLLRHETYTSKAMEYFAPVYGPWKGNSRYPVFVGVTREGQFVSLDPYNTSASFNIAIAARSGAGKSVLGGNLVKSVLTTGGINGKGDGGQVFIIDVGGSYKALAKQYASSQYIEFGEADSNLSLDPFADLSGLFDEITEDLGEEGVAERLISLAGAEKLVMIINLLKIMAAPDGKIDNFQSSRMLTIIKDMCTADTEGASITRFAELCLQDPDPRITDIGHQLQPFTRTGVYGRMFDRTLAPPVAFDSRMIVCELNQLKSQPHLQTVVLMSIIQQAQDSMFRSNDGRRRMFLLDEAWEYIGEQGANTNNEFFSAFLEAGWRRFRKTNAAGVCITQQVSDYHSTKTGRAIFANSPWRLTLAQEDVVIDRLKNEKLIEASESYFDLLKSVQTVKGQYSEIMVDYEGVVQVIRLYADDQSMLIHSTDPKDKKLIASFEQRLGNTRDAIAAAAKEKSRLLAANAW